MAESWIAQGLKEEIDDRQPPSRGGSWITQSITEAFDRDAKRKRREAAERKVVGERKEGTAGQIAQDLAWDFVRGTPVGPYMDEARALGSSLMGGASYEDALAYERAANRAIDRSSPVLIKDAPLVGDITAGGVAKTLGGVAGGGAVAGTIGRAGRLGPALVGPGRTPARTVVKLAAGGAASGATYGFGEGEGSFGDRAQNAGLGAVVGGVAGPALYGAGSLGTRAVQSGLDWVRPTPGPLQGRSRGAVDTLRRVVEMDDTSLGRQQMDLQRRLSGRRGMVVDSGDAAQGLAQGAIASSTPARGTVRNALRQRGQESVSRLESAANVAMSQGEDIVDLVTRRRDQAEQIFTPAYDQFRNTPLTLSPQTNTLLQRIERAFPGLQDEVRDTIENSPRTQPQWLQNNGHFLDNLRQALRDISDPSNPLSGDRMLSRGRRQNAGDFAENLNAAIDSEVARAGQRNLYSTARNEYRNFASFEEGVEAGRRLLTQRDVSPGMIRQMIQRHPTSAAYAEGLRTAARNDLRVDMMTGRSVYGQDPAEARGAATALRNLSGRDAAERLRAMGFDSDEIRDLLQVVREEGTYLQTRNAVLGGSQTAERQEARRMFPQVRDREETFRGLGQRTTQGLPLELTARTFYRVFEGEINEQILREAQDLGEMLITQGVERDALVAALRDVTDQLVRDEGQRRTIGQMLARLGTATSQRALGQPAGEPLRVEVTRGDVERNQ
jgi:hypothetical protein